MTISKFDLKSARTELIRKSIHFSIALFPFISAWNHTFSIFFLIAGISLYIRLENLRMNGFSIPFFSSLTIQAARKRDEGHFVLGPVTLGLGALLVTAFFPPETAAIAIFALAFGDGFASLVGKPFGRIKPAFMFGKSVEGTMACFLAVLFVTWKVTNNLSVTLMAALTTAIVEALPLEDFDNLLIPLSVALAVSLI